MRCCGAPCLLPWCRRLRRPLSEAACAPRRVLLARPSGIATTPLPSPTAPARESCSKRGTARARSGKLYHLTRHHCQNRPERNAGDLSLMRKSQRKRSKTAVKKMMFPQKEKCRKSQQKASLLIPPSSGAESSPLTGAPLKRRRWCTRNTLRP